jgi:hypothetical protein
MVSNIVLGNTTPDSSIGDELLRLQQQQLLTQRRQQQDEDDKIKYLADQLDFKNFATGTAADPVINENLNGLMQKYMMRVRDNKGESLSSLLMDMSKDVGGLKQYSLNAQGVRKGIEARSKEFGENKDIDASGLQRDAMAMAFFKTDPATGQLVPRGADEIDPNTDYTGELLKRQKGRYIKGRSGLYNYIKGMDEVKPSGKFKEEDNGVTKTYNWGASVKPFEEILNDKNGNPVGTRVMQDKPVKIGDKEVITFPKEAYDKLFGGQEWDAYIEADLDEKIRQAKQQDPRFDVTDPRQIDILKRAIAYDYLKAFRPTSDFNKDESNIESTFKEKMDAGYAPRITVNTGGGTTTKQDPSVIQAYKELDGITTAALTNAKSKAVTMRDLNSSQQKLIVKELRDIGKEGYVKDDVDPTLQTGIFIRKNDDGTIGVYKYDKLGVKDGNVKRFVLQPSKENLLTTIDPTNYDVNANTPLGVKSKTEAVKQNKKPSSGINWK